MFFSHTCKKRWFRTGAYGVFLPSRRTSTCIDGVCRRRCDFLSFGSKTDRHRDWRSRRPARTASAVSNRRARRRPTRRCNMLPRRANRPTDRPTDRLTDRPTDRPTDRYKAYDILHAPDELLLIWFTVHRSAKPCQSDVSIMKSHAVPKSPPVCSRHGNVVLTGWSYGCVKEVKIKRVWLFIRELDSTDWIRIM